MPLWKRHENISCLLGGLAGCKILQKAGKAEMSMFLLLCFGHEIRWGFAVADHVCLAGLVAARFCRKLETAEMSSVWQGSRRDVGDFEGFLLQCFGHEIKCCFAVAEASQRHILQKLGKVKCLDFCRDPEGALVTLRGSFCNVLGTKLGGVLPLRKRHKGISCLLGGLGGCKILRKAGNAETSRF